MPPPQQPLSICLSDHIQSTAENAACRNPNKNSTKNSNNNNDAWSLVSGFSKDPAEDWTDIGNNNNNSNGGANSALNNIYRPAASSRNGKDQTSEGIVVQALNVVSDESSRSASECSHKKIAKKRRKQNGGVDVEHTKSSKEFLRKAQQSLRELNMREETILPTAAQPQASLRTKSINHPDSRRRRILAKEQQIRSKSCSKIGELEEDDSLDSSAANQYGYEDPDKAEAPIQVRRGGGLARRRGSVTKYSVQTIAAAAKATERIQGLQRSRRHLEAASAAAAVAAVATQHLQSMQSPNSDALPATPRRPASRVEPVRGDGLQRQRSQRTDSGSSKDSGRSRRHRHRRMGERQNSEISLQSNTADRSKTPRRGRKDELQKLQQSLPVALPQEEPSRSMSMPMPMPMPIIMPYQGSSNSNPYGYEDPDASRATTAKQTARNPNGYHEDMTVPRDTTTQTSKAASNSYGYEDPDAPKSSNPYGYGDPEPQKNSNPYGYGDSEPQPRPIMRHRPQRRGSVTKFSLDAATTVSYKANTPISGNKKLAVPMDIEIIASSSLAAPDFNPQPVVRQTSAWQLRESLKAQRSLSFSYRKKALVARSSGSLRSVVNASPSRSESFRSNPNNASPSRSESFRSNPNIDLDASDDESLDDSVYMIMPLVDSAARAPSRNDSFRSFASKGSSSGRSLEDDMQSLCSISNRGDPTSAPPPPPPPPPPHPFLPCTPTPKCQTHKSLSTIMTTPNNKTLAPKVSARGLEKTDSGLQGWELREKFRNEPPRTSSFKRESSVPVMTFDGMATDITSPLSSPIVQTHRSPITPPQRYVARTTSATGSSRKVIMIPKLTSPPKSGPLTPMTMASTPSASDRKQA
jgi:hypothetical protein